MSHFFTRKPAPRLSLVHRFSVRGILRWHARCLKTPHDRLNYVPCTCTDTHAPIDSLAIERVKFSTARLISDRIVPLRFPPPCILRNRLSAVDGRSGERLSGRLLVGGRTRHQRRR